MTHICVRKITTTGSDNGLSSDWHQAIIWTNAGILLIGPLDPNFSEFLIENYIFSFKKMHLKMLSVKWRPFCLSLNWLNHQDLVRKWNATWQTSIPCRVLGWGLLSQFSPFRYFPIFSEWSKQWLPVWYQVHIWQVSPQLSCGDTWQIWTWLKLSDLYFC